jgi:hypothetical protein
MDTMMKVKGKTLMEFDAKGWKQSILNDFTNKELTEKIKCG